MLVKADVVGYRTDLKYTMYVLSIRTGDGAEWLVHRRYSEFRALRDELSPGIRNALPKLPRTLLSSKSEEFVQKRASALRVFLAALLSHPEIRAGRPECVTAFLRLHAASTRRDVGDEDAEARRLAAAAGAPQEVCLYKTWTRCPRCVVSGARGGGARTTAAAVASAAGAARRPGARARREGVGGWEAAEVVVRDGAAWLECKCPEHGLQQTLVSSDAAFEASMATFVGGAGADSNVESCVGAGVEGPGGDGAGSDEQVSDEGTGVDRDGGERPSGAHPPPPTEPNAGVTSSSGGPPASSAGTRRLSLSEAVAAARRGGESSRRLLLPRRLTAAEARECEEFSCASAEAAEVVQAVTGWHFARDGPMPPAHPQAPAPAEPGMPPPAPSVAPEHVDVSVGVPAVVEEALRRGAAGSAPGPEAAPETTRSSASPRGVVGVARTPTGAGPRRATGRLGRPPPRGQRPPGARLGVPATRRGARTGAGPPRPATDTAPATGRGRPAVAVGRHAARVPDLEDIAREMRAAPPLMVEVAVSVGAECVDRASLEESARHFLARVPADKRVVCRAVCGLAADADALSATLHALSERVAGHPVWVECTPARAVALCAADDSVFKRPSVYPLVQVFAARGEEAAAAHALAAALDASTRFVGIHVMAEVVVGSPIPRLAPVLSVLLSRPELVRVVILRTERDPAALATGLRTNRATLGAAARPAADVAVDPAPARAREMSGGGGSGSGGSGGEDIDYGAGSPQAIAGDVDSVALLRAVESATQGAIAPRDFFPLDAAGVVEPFMTTMGLERFSLAADPTCLRATVLVHRAPEAAAAPAPLGIPVTRFVDVRRFHREAAPMLRRAAAHQRERGGEGAGAGAGALSLRDLARLRSIVKRTRFPELRVPDPLSFLLSSAKRQELLEFVGRLQVLVVHNMMDDAATDLVRHCRCAVQSLRRTGTVCAACSSDV